jgi:hypothetical protein
VVIPASFIAVAFFVLRRAIEHGVELGASAILFDKWHLGPLRLLDFVSVAALLIVFQSILKPLAIKPLVMLGQSSLQVFCVHLLFCFAGLTLLGNASMLNGWRQLGLLATTFTAMLLTAKFFSKSEAKRERQPKAGSSSGQYALANSLVQREQPELATSPIPAINDPLPVSATGSAEWRNGHGQRD